MGSTSRTRQAIRIALTGFCVCAAAGAVLQMEHRRPLTELERAGAALVCDADNRLLSVSLSLPEAGDDLLRQIARFPTVTSVQFDGGRATAAGFRELTALSDLQSLDLSGTSQGTGWLREIADYPSLRALYLRRCRWLTDQELAPLSRHPTLESLVLSEGDISDAAFGDLAKSARLKHLRVEGCPRVSDAGLRILAEHSRLETVTIIDCPLVSGEGIRRLAALPTLRRLSADGIPVQRSVLREIAESHPQLSLTLDRVEIPEFEPLVRAGALIGLDAAYNVRWVDLDNRRDDVRIIRPILTAPHMEAVSFLEQHEAETLETTEGLFPLLALIPETPAVYVRNLAVSSADLQTLENFRQLQQLVLENVAITDHDLEHLRECRQLETLSLRGTLVTGEGVAALGDLPGFRELILLSDHVSSAGVEAIAGLQNLEILAIGNLDSATIAEHIVDLPRLRHLAIVGGTLKATEAERLQHAVSLRRLHLQNVAIPSDAMSPLMDMPQLGSMLLSHCEFDRESLWQFQRRRHSDLQLSITRSPVDEALNSMLP